MNHSSGDKKQCSKLSVSIRINGSNNTSSNDTIYVYRCRNKLRYIIKQCAGDRKTKILKALIRLHVFSILTPFHFDVTGFVCARRKFDF
jgi:hypothetical protein